jgi:membrane associated rhomboid family serine protease
MDWKRYNNNLKKRFSKEKMRREFNEIIKGITKRDLLLLPIIATIIELLPIDFQNVLKLNVQNPSWWQFLTSAFTHQNFEHYFGNMISFLVT